MTETEKLNPASTVLTAKQHRISSGVTGLDAVLHGGFPSGHVYLVEGEPGSGKTTLALQFLLDGVRRGEPVLYVTLSESRRELQTVAESHGWSLDSISIFELNTQESLKLEEQYTVFHPSEVELNDTSRALFKQLDEVQPVRVVFDSLSELRLLAREPLRYRRQILALKQYFVSRETTVLLLDDRTAEDQHEQLQSISHGVVSLERLNIEYGSERRRLTVEKLRGSTFREGFHDYIVETGGLRVFPRLVGAEHATSTADFETVGTGIEGVDTLINGGVDRGTSTLLMGPAGSGKSSIASSIVTEAARRGERSLIFGFDEVPSMIVARAEGLGIPMRQYIESGMIRIDAVDPSELSPGEFIDRIRKAVERDGCRVLVIDSINGFIQAMPGEKFVLIQLHELLTFLNYHGVISILILAQFGLVGGRVDAPIEISYIADSLILLRYFEVAGRVRRAISAVKRRAGGHEQTIRELIMRSGSITVGQPLEDFHGILSGSLVYTGGSAKLDSGKNGE